jgi:hypothetical protein
MAPVFACLHNRRKSLPDATEYLQSYEGNRGLAEKQAEVIRYMEQKARLLGREIIGLHAELEKQRNQSAIASKVGSEAVFLMRRDLAGGPE